MRTSSSASAIPLATANANSESTPPKSDSSASFQDVLQQEGGDGSDQTALNGQPSVPKANPASAATTPITTSPATTIDDEIDQVLADEEASASDTAPTNSGVPTVNFPAKAAATPSANTSPKNNISAHVAASGLSAMIVQAAVQISNLKQTSTTKTPSAGTDSAATGNAPSQNATSTNTPVSPVLANLDLSALIAQATSLVSNVSPAPTVKTPSGSTATSPSTSAGNASSSNTTPATQAALFMTSGSDLSSLIAQANILAANASTSVSTQTSVATSTTAQISSLSTTPGALAAALIAGKEIPSTASNQNGTTTPTKEKKSANKSSEGTFLQDGTTSSTTSTSTFNLLSSSLAGMNQAPAGEQVTNTNSSKNSALESLSGTASGIAGTANVEKESAMNATSIFPEIFAGTNTVPQQTPVDMHIQLSTNNDFEDALKQVMHVAQLTETSPTSRAPMRVEMEIQTPPGAIVNVYVSKQNDQWRAQLSTNDPQALAWVQDKMSTLRDSNDLGVEVRWLPPQMESISTSSSSSESGLGWDRGQQGDQQGYQQQNEQQQSGRQKRSELFAGIGVGQFMETLTAVGGVA